MSWKKYLDDLIKTDGTDGVVPVVQIFLKPGLGEASIVAGAMKKAEVGDLYHVGSVQKSVQNMGDIHEGDNMLVDNVFSASDVLRVSVIRPGSRIDIGSRIHGPSGHA